MGAGRITRVVLAGQFALAFVLPVGAGKYGTSGYIKSTLFGQTHPDLARGPHHKNSSFPNPFP